MPVAHRSDCPLRLSQRGLSVAGAGTGPFFRLRHLRAREGKAWGPEATRSIGSPSVQILVELAELQDAEVGDGTTSVVIIASELLKRANGLVRNKIHPTSIISGYRLAMRESCKYIEEHLSHDIEKLGKDTLINCAKTSMSSKARAPPYACVCVCAPTSECAFVCVSPTQHRRSASEHALAPCAGPSLSPL